MLVEESLPPSTAPGTEAVLSGVTVPTQFFNAKGPGVWSEGAGPTSGP